MLVRNQLPELELYLTENEKDNYSYWPNWLLDPSSTPRYLVCIGKRIEQAESDDDENGDYAIGTYYSIVLVFDQLNDPQFLHRLVLPAEGRDIRNPQLITIKGVEQTALVIEQNDRVYISDLVNDFKEINVREIHCIGNQMYRTEIYGEGYYYDPCDYYYLDLSFDGERFLLNESKLEKFDLDDFTREEIASCLPILHHCLPYHMDGKQFRSEFPIRVMDATDTRLLWSIRFSKLDCENQNCPIRQGFRLYVEQDFLMNSRARSGNEFKKIFA